MFISFLRGAIRLSSIFLYGSAGEILTEKSGHLNLGIPGIMCFGAVGGCLGAYWYTQGLNGAAPTYFGMLITAILCSFLFAGMMGLLFSFFTVSLKLNQNVTGLTITTFGAGVMNFWGQTMANKNIKFFEASKFFTQTFPCAEDNWFTQLFLSYGTLVYLGIAIAIILSLYINKTRSGMNLRACGENPAAADAAGVNVTLHRYLSCTIGAGIAGLGGLFYIMDYLGGSIEYTVDALGWIAVALVIFSLWKPSLSMLGSLLFGILTILPYFVTTKNLANIDLIKMIPYAVTTIVLIIISIVGKKETQPPTALGVTYFREDR